MPALRVMITAAIAAYGACTPYDPNLSETPFFCGSTDPKCPEGYTCVPAATGSAVCTSSTPPPGGTCGMAFSGVLATWNLAGEPGTQAGTATTTSAPGVVATAITRAATLTPATGAGSINASGWPTSAQLDPTAYFTFSIGAPSGCSLALDTLSIDVKSSNTGPATASVSTSVSSFSQAVSVSTTGASTPSLSISGTTTVEIRIYGFSASASTGTMRVQNTLTVMGALR